MKCKKITIMAAVVWGLCIFALPAQGKYGGGSGEPDHPYLIYTAEQINAIGADANDWDKHFNLMADIDLSGFTGTNFNIIGINYQHPFTGVFNGNGHIISNFTYTSTDRDYIGLFGYVYGENAEIKNLGLIDPNVDAGTGEYVGALVGWLYDEKITDCYVEGGSVKGYCYVGGMVGVVGYLWGDSDIGTVTNCYSNCTVSGYCWIGGLVGINRGTITNCNSNSGISGFHGIGGLVGCNYRGTISSCYSTGSVAGDHRVGGLVGGNEGTITNSFASSGVSANEEVGGLVGYNGYMGTIPPPSLPMNRIKGQVSDISFAEPTSTFQANNDVPIMSGYASLGEQDFYSATITNCSSAGSVIGNGSVGGLVGGNYGRVSNCYSTGNVDGGGSVGGLVGLNSGNMSNCYSTGDVSGYGSVGGLVGTNRHDNISSCYSTGDVNGVGEVGGLVGRNGDWHTPGGAISNCYSTGSVSGDTVIGGLVGGNYAGLLATAKILKCYSTGSVSGDTVIGGLVGSNEVEVSDSFWDVNTSGLDYSAAGTGLPTDKMQTMSTFTNAGWDFVEIWNIGENQTYPYLRVYLTGDINKDGIVNFLDIAITANQWMEEYFLWNRPPEVLITYPQDGDRLMVGGVPPQTMILAEANDYDGTVVRVEFFDDGLKLGEDTDGSDGWSYLWQGYSLGYHTLTAVAWDQEGLSGTSPPVNVEVWMPYPPPP